MGRVHGWWRRSLDREIARLREGGRAALLWSSRVTAAATASYVVALLIFPGTLPLLAPLTAMLVVQVTPVSLLASGLDRVVAVVSGVSLAVAFSVVVPLHWWSLGALLFVSLTLGQVLRLRSNLIEVAISAMLVLGVGTLGAEAAAWQRLTVTLVGAAVGIAVNLLIPPKVGSADAGQAIDSLADRVGDLLTRAADEPTELVARDRDVAVGAREWLDDARRITHEDVPRAGAALLRAEQGRRFNVRAVGTADVGPGLRQGLEALEHSTVALRGMFRAFADATYDAPWLHDETAPDVLLGLAQTFRDLAAGVDAFGRLVRIESDPTLPLAPDEVTDLRSALDGLHDSRARLDELFLSSDSQLLLELHAAVLATVKRLLQEMDLDERVRRQVRLLRRRRPHRSPVPSDQPTEPGPDAETQLLPRQRPNA
ncbi:aromatic acid exporter family protein [soil metagenome]